MNVQRGPALPGVDASPHTGGERSAAAGFARMDCRPDMTARISEAKSPEIVSFIQELAFLKSEEPGQQ